MAQTGLQRPGVEWERHSATQKDSDAPSLRDLPFPLRKEIEAFGFGPTLCERIESERRFRELFGHGPVANREIDHERIMRRINRAECGLLGIGADTVLGKHTSEFVSPDRQAKRREAVKRKQSGQPAIVPFLREDTHSDGRHLTIEVHDDFAAEGKP